MGEAAETKCKQGIEGTDLLPAQAVNWLTDSAQWNQITHQFLTSLKSGCIWQPIAHHNFNRGSLLLLVTGRTRLHFTNHALSGSLQYASILMWLETLLEKSFHLDDWFLCFVFYTGLLCITALAVLAGLKLAKILLLLPPTWDYTREPSQTVRNLFFKGLLYKHEWISETTNSMWTIPRLSWHT